jgi:SAM-dependent methyltransferase
MKTDPLGQAVWDFYNNDVKDKLITRADQLDDDELPIHHLFRSKEELNEIEDLALSKAKGSILDIGAGSGCHSIILQDKGFKVTAMDISPLAVKTMKARGLNAIEYDIFNYNEPASYDTIYLLMNGIGVCGYLENLESLLNHLKTLLKIGGSIIFDSSDLRYLYENEDGSISFDLNADRYYGQFEFQMEYHDHKSDWFDWVYIDPNTLQAISEKNGFEFQILMEADNYHYLYELKIK